MKSSSMFENLIRAGKAASLVAALPLALGCAAPATQYSDLHPGAATVETGKASEPPPVSEPTSAPANSAGRPASATPPVGQTTADTVFNAVMFPLVAPVALPFMAGWMLVCLPVIVTGKGDC